MTERNAMVEWERAEAREWNTGRNVDAWQRDPRGDETNVAYATSWPKRVGLVLRATRDLWGMHPQVAAAMLCATRSPERRE